MREDDAEPTQVYVRPDDDESTQAVAGYDDFGIVLDRFSRVFQRKIEYTNSTRAG